MPKQKHEKEGVSHIYNFEDKKEKMPARTVEIRDVGFLEEKFKEFGKTLDDGEIKTLFSLAPNRCSLLDLLPAWEEELEEEGEENYGNEGEESDENFDYEEDYDEEEEKVIIVEETDCCTAEINSIRAKIVKYFSAEELDQLHVMGVSQVDALERLMR